MKIEVHVLNDKYETVKVIDGFDSLKAAEDFAKDEAAWRGVPVEAGFYNDVNTWYSHIF